jgi:hypothetical protein
MDMRKGRQAGAAGMVALLALVVVAALAAAWLWVFTNWDYSTGERAGWVQKLSKKGWLCKTWEGEMAMVTMPGTAQEKFLFTVRSDEIAGEINKVMGRRVSVHYEEKVGLPTTCFGETRHFVTRIVAVEDIPLAPGIVVPVQPPPAAAPPSATAVPAPATAPK